MIYAHRTIGAGNETLDSCLWTGGISTSRGALPHDQLGTQHDIFGAPSRPRLGSFDRLGERLCRCPPLAVHVLPHSPQGRRDAPARRVVVEAARDVAMNGALVYSCDLAWPAVGWSTRRTVPLVFVDQPPTAGIPSGNIDDRGGARAAAQHVLDLGHRRVGIATSEFGGDFGVLEKPGRRRLLTASHNGCSE